MFISIKMFPINVQLILNNKLKNLFFRQLSISFYDFPQSISTLQERNFLQSYKLQSMILRKNVRPLNLSIRQCPGFCTEPPLLEEIDSVTYERVCSETLESLCEYFEDIIEKYPIFKSADVSFGDGVLTINLDKFGTYVINRQSPNKQIWLSSPRSGPKRYDFQRSRNGWVYRHNGQTLHSLLQEELAAIIRSPVDLSNCAFYGGC